MRATINTKKFNAEIVEEVAEQAQIPFTSIVLFFKLYELRSQMENCKKKLAENISMLNYEVNEGE
jgi:hypothetical protein